MKAKLSLHVLLTISSFVVEAQTAKFTGSIIDEQISFEEQDGLVAVEVEYFYKKDKLNLANKSCNRNISFRNKAVKMFLTCTL